DGFPVLLGDHTSDLATQAVIEEGLDALAAAARDVDVPVLVYFYGAASLSQEHYVGYLRARAAGVPDLHVLGMFAPDDSVGAGIAGDGHPTAAGNAWYAERLADALLALPAPTAGR